MIEPQILLRFGIALALVLALIMALTWIARRYGGGLVGGTPGSRRLAVVESIALDRNSRLVLVRRDGTEHLIALAPGGAVVVEAGTPAPAPASARSAP